MQCIATGTDMVYWKLQLRLIVINGFDVSENLQAKSNGTILHENGLPQSLRGGIHTKWSHTTQAFWTINTNRKKVVLYGADRVCNVPTAHQHRTTLLHMFANEIIFQIEPVGWQQWDGTLSFVTILCTIHRRCVCDVWCDVCQCKSEPTAPTTRGQKNTPTHTHDKTLTMTCVKFSTKTPHHRPAVDAIEVRILKGTENSITISYRFLSPIPVTSNDSRGQTKCAFAYT